MWLLQPEMIGGLARVKTKVQPPSQLNTCNYSCIRDFIAMRRYKTESNTLPQRQGHLAQGRVEALSIWYHLGRGTSIWYQNAYPDDAASVDAGRW